MPRSSGRRSASESGRRDCPAPAPARRRLRASAIGLLVLVLLQIYLGALVAGLVPGYVYNTWPLIDGALHPEAARLLLDAPLWRNFFENTLTVQFDHRMLAYAIWLCALSHAYRRRRAARRPALCRALSHCSWRSRLQAALGICDAAAQCRFRWRCCIRRWRSVLLRRPCMRRALARQLSLGTVDAAARNR